MSYLLQVCELYDWHPPTTTLAAVLTTMCQKIFKAQCTDGLILQVLRQRFVSFDHDIGVDDLVHMDWVTELFDKSTSEEVSKQVQASKAHRAHRSDYVAEVHQYQEHRHM